MRRTLFVFNRDLLGPIQAAVELLGWPPPSARRLAKDVERGGLHDDGAAWLDGARAATLRALAELGSATSSELKAAVPVLEGYLDLCTGQVLRRQAVRGAAGADDPVGIGRRAAWPQPGRLDDVAAGVRADLRLARRASSIVPDPDDAIDELVARWLIAFGPGTLTDIKWWFGSTLTIIRAVAGSDRCGRGRSSTARPATCIPTTSRRSSRSSHAAALLPGLDPTTMGWFERDWYLGPHRPEIFDSNGNGGPTAWWDGRIVGSWIQGPTGEVTVHLLDDVGRDWQGCPRCRGRPPRRLARRDELPVDVPVADDAATARSGRRGDALLADPRCAGPRSRAREGSTEPAAPGC